MFGLKVSYLKWIILVVLLVGLVNVTNIQSNELRQLTRNMTVISLPNGSMNMKKTDKIS